MAKKDSPTYYTFKKEGCKSIEINDNPLNIDALVQSGYTCDELETEEESEDNRTLVGEAGSKDLGERVGASMNIVNILSELDQLKFKTPIIDFVKKNTGIELDRKLKVDELKKEGKELIKLGAE